MVSQNLRQAYLQELGLAQMSEDHYFFNIFFQHEKFRTNLRADFITYSKTDKFSQIGRVWDILYQTKSSPLFPPTKYAMVPQHGPFSLYTMLEGPWLHKMAFSTPMVRPLDESQGSSPLQGHGSWLVCEVALNSTNLCMKFIYNSEKYTQSWKNPKTYGTHNYIRSI